MGPRGLLLPVQAEWSHWRHALQVTGLPPAQEMVARTTCAASLGAGPTHPSFSEVAEETQLTPTRVSAACRVDLLFLEAKQVRTPQGYGSSWLVLQEMVALPTWSG